MMDGGWMPWGGGGMWFGPLLMVAVPVLAIIFVVWLVRAIGGGGSPILEQRISAREILDGRFARGEIDKEEYEDRRKTLGV